MVRIPINNSGNPQSDADLQHDAEEQSTIHYASATNPPQPSTAQTDSTGTYRRGGDTSATDASVPPAPQPPSMQGRSSLGPVAGEVAGLSGADVTGGDLTPHQDAGDALEEVTQTRRGESAMWEQQQRGEVSTQTHDLKPSSANPEEGLPANPDGKESSGGANDADAMSAAETNTTARAAADGDDRFLQLAADFENFKRQAARRESEAKDRAARHILEDLLPVLDNFDRAVQAAETARDVQSLKIGVEYILQQLRDVLKNHGVEPIETQGQKFDPLHHDALEQVPNSGQPEGTVINEVQRGYNYKGQVLRTSRVRVAG